MLPLRSGHCQTIWTSQRRASLNAASTSIQIPTSAAFSWTGSLYSQHQSKVAILLHGLGGQSNSPYMLETTKALLQKGYDVACMALPGGENDDPYTYHAGDHVHLDAIEKFFTGRYQQLHWIGFSLGGNMVLKWLAKAKPQAGALVISPVTDLNYGVAQVDQKLFGLYRRHFLSSLLRVVRKKIVQHPEVFSHLAPVLQVRTLEGFDRDFTCPFHGYPSTQAYYRANQAKDDLQQIHTPTYILSAQDDPFVSKTDFQAPRAHSLVRISPMYGGHLGFFDRFNAQSMLERWVGKIL